MKFEELMKLGSNVILESEIPEEQKPEVEISDFAKLQSDLLNEPEKSLEEINSEYIRYLNMKDPSTGKPYAIPLLDYTDPNYSEKYVDLMKMKEYNPDGFKKIMEWK